MQYWILYACMTGYTLIMMALLIALESQNVKLQQQIQNVEELLCAHLEIEALTSDG